MRFIWLKLTHFPAARVFKARFATWLKLVQNSSMGLGIFVIWIWDNFSWSYVRTLTGINNQGMSVSFLFHPQLIEQGTKPKNSDTIKICCNYTKHWTVWFYDRVNARSSLIWVHTVCLDLPVWKLIYFLVTGQEKRCKMPKTVTQMYTCTFKYNVQGDCNEYNIIYGELEEIFLYLSNEPRQANLCLRAFRHDKL